MGGFTGGLSEWVEWRRSNSINAPGRQSPAHLTADGIAPASIKPAPCLQPDCRIAAEQGHTVLGTCHEAHGIMLCSGLPGGGPSMGLLIPSYEISTLHLTAFRAI
jgi:hypothetical protein